MWVGELPILVPMASNQHIFRVGKSRAVIAGEHDLNVKSFENIRQWFTSNYLLIALAARESPPPARSVW